MLDLISGIDDEDSRSLSKSSEMLDRSHFFIRCLARLLVHLSLSLRVVVVVLVAHLSNKIEMDIGALISKVLGYAIITGSLILKVPQILKVSRYRAHFARDIHRAIAVAFERLHCCSLLIMTWVVVTIVLTASIRLSSRAASLA